MFRLGCTLSNLAKRCLHKSTNRKFDHFGDGQGFSRENMRRHGWQTIHFIYKESCCGRYIYSGFDKLVQVDCQELMLVNFFFSVCLKQCQLVCTQDRNLIRNLENLNQFKTRRRVLKTLQCLTFSESDHSVKWRNSTRPVHRKKLMHTLLMAFVDTETLCLKPRDAIVIFAHVNKLIFLSLRKKFRDIKKRKLDELREQDKQAKCNDVLEIYE